MFKLNQHNAQSHGIVKMPWLTLGLTAILIVLYCWGQNVFNSLLFNTQAIYAGEWWRLITGHFVHCNFEHFLWDTLAFMILGIIIENHSRQSLILVLIISCLTVSGWLLWGQTERLTYCGLSGALNGLLVVAVMMLWNETNNIRYLFIIVATIAKIIFESITHQTIFTNLASQAIPGAHAAGLVAGGIFVVYHMIRNNLFLHPYKCRYN